MANGRTMEYRARIACVGCGISHGRAAANEDNAWADLLTIVQRLGWRLDRIDGDLCGSCYATIENEMATAEGRR